MDDQSDGGGGNFLSGLLCGLFGGFRAEGGPVDPGHAYIVGERGPEYFVPSTSGSITTGGANGGVTIINNVDARGAAPGVGEEVKRALKETENRAVARALVAQSELDKRR